MPRKHLYLGFHLLLCLGNSFLLYLASPLLLSIKRLLNMPSRRFVVRIPEKKRPQVPQVLPP